MEAQRKHYNGFGNQEVIFTPLDLGKRDDRKGLHHGDATLKGDLKVKTIEKDGVEETEMVIMFGGQPLPTDAEIAEMKRQNAIQRKWYNRARNWLRKQFCRVLGWLGIGG